MVISSIFASGQLHLAFIKCNDDEELKELVWLFRFYSVFGILAVSLLVFILNIKYDFIPKSYLILFPFSILAYLGFEEGKMLTVRAQNFKFMSIAVGSNRLISNMTKVLSGRFFPSPFTLIFTEFLTNIFSWFQIKKKIKIDSSRPESIGKILRKYKVFPIFETFSCFFQLGLTELPVLLLAVYYSANDTGLYVLVLKILLQPLTVIGNSLGSVVAKNLVTAHASARSSKKLIGKIYSGYFGLGLLILLGLWLIPSSWFTLILGKNWGGIKYIFLPLSVLSAAKLSSGLQIYYHVSTGKVISKTLWKALELGSVIATIIIFHGMPFNDLLWIMCGVEATIDFLFIIYTIFKANEKTSS